MYGEAIMGVKEDADRDESPFAVRIVVGSADFRSPLFP